MLVTKIVVTLVLMVTGIIPTDSTERISTWNDMDPDHVYVTEWRYDWKGDLIEKNKFVVDYDEYCMNHEGFGAF